MTKDKKAISVAYTRNVSNGKIRAEILDLKTNVFLDIFESFDKEALEKTVKEKYPNDFVNCVV